MEQQGQWFDMAAPLQHSGREQWRWYRKIRHGIRRPAGEEFLEHVKLCGAVFTVVKRETKKMETNWLFSVFDALDEKANR
ncbi:MAG: hypothetical protein AAFP90_20600 [Planctomycetota bacterium]